MPTESVLLLQLDGKLPNIALMRAASHYRSRGCHVTLRQAHNIKALAPKLWDQFDIVLASTIFTRTQPMVEKLLTIRPDAVVGGTGTPHNVTLETFGVSTLRQDYSDYPEFQQSIGFTQRGCRLKCPFCVVPGKEGKVQFEQSIFDIWRGGDSPREILLLDNDFFGQPDWRTRIREIGEGEFKVSFTQGINARMITPDAAQAIASVNYRDNSMRRRRIYTAWDNRKDESRLFKGLKLLADAGIKPSHIMVYMLISYWQGETESDWEYRRQKLREFGCLPYPMPYVRNKATVGFQRFVVGAYDKRFSWKEFTRADYRPEKLG